MVSKTTGDPEGYADHNKHPELYRTDHIIETEDELRRCMRSNVTEFPPARPEGGRASVGADKQNAEEGCGCAVAGLVAWIAISVIIIVAVL